MWTINNSADKKLLIDEHIVYVDGFAGDVVVGGFVRRERMEWWTGGGLESGISHGVWSLSSAGML